MVGLDVLGAAEDLEGRVALDAEALAEVLLLGAVDLGERDVLVLERGGGLLVLGSERLAVAAPWCEDCGIDVSMLGRDDGYGCGDLHSASTRPCSLTNGSKVSLVSSCTSLAVARAASAARPKEYLMISPGPRQSTRTMNSRGTCPTNCLVYERVVSVVEM